MVIGHLDRHDGREVGGDSQQPQHAGPRRTRSDAAGLRRRGSRVQPGQTRERQGETLQSVQQEEVDAPSSPPLILLFLIPLVLFGVAPHYRSISCQILVEDVRVD